MNLRNIQKASRLLIVAAFTGISMKADAQKVEAGKVNIGLIYPVSTNGLHAASDTNCFSFNLISGVSAAERGFTLAGVSNIVRHDAKGIQIAGFSNHLGKQSEGMMIAGFMNTYAGGTGIQLAGFLNHATEVQGTQISGFGNLSKDIRGTQLAGFINKAGDVTGTQVSGFINIAGKVKGVQLAGFINIADSSDHPVGLVNIIKNGEKSLGMSMDDSHTAMLSFRSGGRTLYGILAVGYNLDNDEEVYAFEAGLGAHILNTSFFRINTEVSMLNLESFYSGEYFKGSLKFMPSLRPLRTLEIFGGPAFNYVNTNTLEGRSLTSKYIRTWENRRGNSFEGIYIGYNAGINILF
jgi:hypothetical protein